MANIIQKLIYNLSAASPLCIILAIVWYLQEETWIVPITLTITGIILFVLLEISFSYGKKHLAPIHIITSDISPNDGWIIAYIISYIIPFANMVIDDFSLELCIGIAVLLIIIVPWINTAIPNPILFVTGYHFYQISAENGMSGYVLISKRKLRKKQDLATVNRVFEFLLIDYEGR